MICSLTWSPFSGLGAPTTKRQRDGVTLVILPKLGPKLDVGKLSQQLSEANVNIKSNLIENSR